MAAVSARRIVGPRPTTGRPDSRSASDQPPSGPTRRMGRSSPGGEHGAPLEVDDGVGPEVGVVTRKKLVNGHVVEAGEPLEAGDRDGPFAPLVGPEHRGLELLPGARFDLLERKPLLLANGAEPAPHLHRVGRIGSLDLDRAVA